MHRSRLILVVPIPDGAGCDPPDKEKHQDAEDRSRDRACEHLWSFD